MRKRNVRRKNPWLAYKRNASRNVNNPSMQGTPNETDEHGDAQWQFAGSVPNRPGYHNDRLMNDHVMLDVYKGHIAIYIHRSLFPEFNPAPAQESPAVVPALDDPPATPEQPERPIRVLRFVGGNR